MSGTVCTKYNTFGWFFSGTNYFISGNLLGNIGVCFPKLPSPHLFRSIQFSICLLHLLRLFLQSRELHQFCPERAFCCQIWFLARNPDSPPSFRSLTWWPSHFSHLLVFPQTLVSSDLCLEAVQIGPTPDQEMNIWVETGMVWYGSKYLCNF